MRRATGALALASLLGAAPLLAACSEPPAAPAEELISTSPNDTLVNEARMRARETAHIFWAKFDAQEAGVSNFAIKLGLTGQDGFVEFIWAFPVRRSADEIVATLANDPVHLKGLAHGSEVRVKPELLADWTYEKAGKAYGHFTTRAMFSRATPEQQAEAREKLSAAPLEPDAP